MEQLIWQARDSFLQAARLNFTLMGYVAPVLILNRNGEIKMNLLTLANHEDKESLAAYITELVKTKVIGEFMLITEAWFVDESPDIIELAVQHLQRSESLKDFPTRKEMISVIYSSPQREVYYSSVIHRTESAASLMSWQESTLERHTFNPYSQRFANIWQFAAAKDN